MAMRGETRIRDAWKQLVLVGLSFLARGLTQASAKMVKERTLKGDVCALDGEPGCKRHRPPIGVLDIETHLKDLIKFSNMALAEIEREEPTDHVVDEIEAVSENVIASYRWIVVHYGGSVNRE